MTVRLDIDRRVATITLDSPGTGNAIDFEFVDHLSRAATEIASDPSVRAVLIRAEGANFCVGGDLRTFGAMGSGIAVELKQLADRLHHAVLVLHDLSVPVVVAVQGNAAGAGLSLALLGDVCLAADSARFRVAYTAVGLTPDGGCTWFLPRLVGARTAAELVLTNRIVDAEEAEALGMINRVVPDDELQLHARDLARHLADGPTGAFAAAKQLLSMSPSATLEEQLRSEAEAISAASATADGREGIQAFLEKRRPQFH